MGLSCPDHRIYLRTCQMCKMWSRERARDYRQKNPEKLRLRETVWRNTHRDRWRAIMRRTNKNRRIETLRIIIAGGLAHITGTEIIKCTTCECTDIDFLEINHKRGYGREIMDAYPGGRMKYSTAIRQGKIGVSDLNILCRPCNAIDHLMRLYPEKSRYPIVTWPTT